MELLVVVAIIGLLLAIVQPSLRHARATSRRTVCMSNLRQLGLACIEYANNHRGYYPGPQALGGKAMGMGAFSAVEFRPARGYRIPDSPDAIPEKYGPNTLFDQFRMIPAQSQVWICPAAASVVRAFGNTYAFDGCSQVDGAGRGDRMLYRAPYCRTKPYLKDFYYWFKPLPTGQRWSTLDILPNLVPQDQWLAPHRLNSMTNDKSDIASSSSGVNGFFYDGHVGLWAMAG